MADVGGPNVALERKKLEVQISQLQHNIQASELREMTLQVELEQIAENRAATVKAIADLEARIADLDVKDD